MKMVRRTAVKTKATPRKLQTSLGVSKVKGGVVFTTSYPAASCVQVAGDFNGWQPQLAPMKKIDEQGTWQIQLPLTAGSYRYRFVVDGQWRHDQNNPASEPNPYGEMNSVLQVGR